MKAFYLTLLAALPLLAPTYLIRFRIGPLPTTLLEVVLFLVLGLFSMCYGLSGWKRAWNELGVLRWSLGAFVLASFCAIWWSPSWVAGLGLWRAFIAEPALLFCVYLFTLKQEPLVQHVERSLYLSVIFLMLWGVVEFIFGIGIPSPWNVAIDAGRRATGPYPYPNALALAVVPIGAYGLMQWLKNHSSFFALSAYVSAIVASLVAKSDGGLIALLAVAWLGGIAHKRLRLLSLIITVIAGLVFISVPAIHVPVLKELRFENWSGYVRKKMWSDTWHMLKDRPFTGAGIAGYPVVFKPYQTTTGIEVFQYPHNMVMNFWSETGLMGVLSFFTFLFSVIVGFWKRTDVAGLLMTNLPLVAILIHGLVDVPYFKNDLAVIFYVIVALLVAQKQEAHA